MREQRELNPWTLDYSGATDEQLLRALLDLSDEASCLQRRSNELVLRLDRIGAVIGERWAPEALERIEQQERREIQAAGDRPVMKLVPPAPTERGVAEAAVAELRATNAALRELNELLAGGRPRPTLTVIQGG